MTPIRFGEGDAWLLWPVPSGGGDLESLVHSYVFIARDAIPPFGKVRECLSRAVRAGILLPPIGNYFELKREWAERFNQIVEKHSTTEDGIMELDEYLSSCEWPEVGPDFQLDENEYCFVAERVEKHFADVFGRRDR
jgi:hypothetical protein